MVLNLEYKRKYYSHTAMDLCHDCMKGFRNWMKEVKQMERLTKRYIDEDDVRESDYIEREKNFVILLSMINTFFTVKKLDDMKK